MLMGNPLAILRRYQRTLLAVFGVIIMFVFVVGGGIDQYLSNRPGGPKPVEPVVTWVDGTISDQDIGYMRHRHDVTMRFLEEIVKLTRERQGNPKVAPLNDGGSPGDLMRTMMFVKRADQMGLVVNDETIFNYLTRLSDAMRER